MEFHGLPIEGAVLVKPLQMTDERGYFARIFSVDQFEAHGLDPRICESSISCNVSAFTLRGLHYQAAPDGEAKLVRCTRGAIWDVILDLRAGTSSYRQWWAIELHARIPQLLYIPPGVAHGFLTLEADSEVHYQMSSPYVAASGRGIRWDDSAFSIEWPHEPRVISERDRSYPDFAP